MADVAKLRRLGALARTRAAAAEWIAAAEARFDAALRASLRAAFAPALSRFGVVASSADAAGASAEDLHVIRSAWAVEVEGKLLPLVAEMYDVGALSALLSLAPALEARTSDELLDTLADVLDRRAAEHLDAAANRLVGVGDQAWSDARDALSQGFAAGEGIDDIAGRVETALGSSEERAITTARTEVVSASNAGSMSGARVLGDYAPQRKVWIATLDPRTRDAHADADGQEVGLDEPFVVGGESLDYPGDPAGSPENVINCRCTVGYVDDGHELDTSGRASDLEDALAAAAGAGPLSPVHIAFAIARRRATTPESTMRPRVPRPAFADAPAAAPAPVPAPVAPVAPAAPAPVTPAPTAVDPQAPAPPVDPAAALVVEVPEGINVLPFSTIMAIEGRWTGDDRYLLPGSVRWDGMLPIPFTADHEDDVPSVVGLIGDVRRVENTPGPGENLIIGYGLFDLGPDERPNDAAYQTSDRVRSGALRGVSIRVDDETTGGVDPASVAEGDDEWWMYVVEDCRLRALSPTPVAAFAECAIFLNPADVEVHVVTTPAPANPAIALPSAEADAAREAIEEAIEEAVESVGGEVVTDIEVDYTAAPMTDLPVDMLVAAAGPLAPPREWFDDPQLDGPTPLTVTDDGRVYGHVALWGQCHTGFADQCITPPHSSPGYAMFRTGEVRCADGSRVPVGRLTMGRGHASTHRSVTPAQAAAHYDNECTTAAYLAAGEDRHGIWVAGAARSNLTDEEAHTLMAHPPSGDWRNIGGRMEMLALLCVNAPGFPVPRARVASGRPMSLVAAGQVTPAVAAAARRRAGDPALVAAAQRIARSVGRGRPTQVAAILERVHGPKVDA